MSINSKYTLVLVDGDFGSGKTLYQVRAAALYHPSLKYVVSNFKLKGIPNFILREDITREFILSIPPNSLLLLDESYLYFDKRECNKKKNIKVTQALFQIRKTGVSIIANMPDADYYDLRCKQVKSAVFIRALGDAKHKDYFTYQQLEYIKNRDVFLPYGKKITYYMKPLYGMYDTKEKLGAGQKSLFTFFDA